MAADVLDYFQKVGWSTATTLSAPGYTIGNTTLTVGSTTNWPTTTGITFAVDTIDSAGERVAGSYNVFRGTVDTATSITNVVYVGGDANQNYSAGATTRVYILVSSYRDNRFTDGILIEHNQDGTHDEALITSRTADTAPASGDSLLTYDLSATALKKVTLSNLWANPALAAGNSLTTGWLSGLLPAVSSVTNNGQRSADVTFASTVAAMLTPGMRIRGTRTVAAPTQCTDLEASSTHYFTKTTPNKLSFTDDFTCMAWVKLESLTLGGIIARRNADTEGWSLAIDGSGRVRMESLRIAANNSDTLSYQGIPVGKWTHIAATTNLSGTSVLIYIDGVLVPSTTTVTGTITALVQGTTALVVGARKSAGNDPFDGKIAQAAVFDAVLSAATIRSYVNQGLAGNETNLLSAYSFNNSITDLNTTTPNDLSAVNSAVATAADSPFGVDANGVPVAYEWGIVTKVATTTATVQFPEGSCFPTSGGVSAVDLSSWKAPFGMTIDANRWMLIELCIAGSATQTTPTQNTYYFSNHQLTVPIGAWAIGYYGSVQYVDNTNAGQMSVTLATSSAAAGDQELSVYSISNPTGPTGTNVSSGVAARANRSLTAQTIYYMNMVSTQANMDSIALRASTGTGGSAFVLFAEFNLL